MRAKGVLSTSKDPHNKDAEMNAYISAFDEELFQDVLRLYKLGKEYPKTNGCWRFNFTAMRAQPEATRVLLKAYRMAVFNFVKIENDHVKCESCTATLDSRGTAGVVRHRVLRHIRSTAHRALNEVHRIKLDGNDWFTTPARTKETWQPWPSNWSRLPVPVTFLEPCGHVLCEECHRRLQAVSNACPVCRRIFNGVSTNRVIN
ncbi:unnamed protein product, partial [Caenorhabditis auriculariae]